MRSIGEYGGLDLTQDIKPPKSLYIEVKTFIGNFFPPLVHHFVAFETENICLNLCCYFEHRCGVWLITANSKRKTAPIFSSRKTVRFVSLFWSGLLKQSASFLVFAIKMCLVNLYQPMFSFAAFSGEDGM